MPNTVLKIVNELKSESFVTTLGVGDQIPRVGEYIRFSISERSSMSVPVYKVEHDPINKVVLCYIKS